MTTPHLSNLMAELWELLESLIPLFSPSLALGLRPRAIVQNLENSSQDSPDRISILNCRFWIADSTQLIPLNSEFCFMDLAVGTAVR